MVHLTRGQESEEYYPRASVADFLTDDSLALNEAPTDAPSGGEIELGARTMDLLGHADGGPAASSAPAVYKGHAAKPAAYPGYDVVDL